MLFRGAHQTAGSAESTDHRLSLFREFATLSAPYATRANTLLLKVDVLAAL